MTTTYKLSTTQTTYVGAAGGDIFDTTANTLLPADVIAGGNGSNALDLQGGGVFNLQAVWKLQGIQFLVAQEGQAAYTVPGTGSTIPATGQTVYLRNGLNLEVDVSNAVLTPGNPTAPGIVIHGASDADLIRLGSGDDTVFVGSANEVIAGGSGAASIYVSAATIGATIDGGTGTATLLVTGGGTLSMGSNLTRISQVSLRDAAPGTTQPNYVFTANALRGLVIAASSGNDTISVGDASQQVIAGAGNDTVLASAATAGALVTGNGTTILRIGGGGTATLNAATGGVNVVLGQATNLTLSAMSGVTATGSAGADTITALASGQTLISQSGQDQLVGAQTGGDTFQGTASGLNGDTLQNFAASGDVIDITDLVDGTGTHLSYVGNATGGVLTATDGTRTARINLTGVFAASGFLPGSDGANGTRLTYTAPSLPLTLAAALSDDTGTSASDGITSDPAVAGTVTSAFGLASFTASLDGGTAASILTGLGSGGAFTVSTAQEQALAGGTIADGRHTLLLTATDIAGDTITDTVPFTLATAAPALSAALADDTGAPANPTLTSDDTITGSLTDPVGIASFIESVDGGPAQSVFGQLSGSGFTLSPAFLGLADGAHTVALTATDIAGNASTVDVGFTLVPTLSITARLADDTGISASDGITSDPAIDGNVSATDAIVALTGSLDGGPADSLLSVLGPNGDFGISAALMQSVAGGTLTDGAHTLLLSATDAGGDTATDSVGFTLETAPPTLTAALADPTGAPSHPSVTSDDTIAGTVADPVGIVALSVSVDGGSADNVLADLQSGGNFQISAAQLGAAAGGTLTDGEHTVAITATDTAGNVSTSDINFTLETTPPSLAFNLAPADQTGTAAQPATNASQVTLTGQTGAGDTVVLLSTGATTVANTSGAFQFINVALSLGGNPLTMQATDAAGNTSSDTLNVQRAAATGGTDSVLQWNQLTLQAIATDADAPTVASRALAMESLAVYDAIAAIDGTPGYLVNLTAASDASAQAAVAEAADQVLDDLYPAQITTFDTQLMVSLAAIPNSLGKTDGIALGEAAAQAIIALRANDGSQATVIDNGSTAVGQWQPTAPGFANAVTPQWANVTPFAMTSPDQFQAPPPPALTSAAYAAAVNETESLGAGNSTTRTAAETQSALWWNLQTGTDTPPGEWNAIATSMAQSQDDSMATDAQILAELNVAEADAGIAAFNTKYTYSAWRPITAIQNASETGNAAIIQNASWTPLLTTPAFPEYVAGHAVFSNAAAQVLDSFFGSNTAFTATSPSLPGVVMDFSSFDAAAQAAGESRVYGGIHFQFSVDAGLTMGQEVGDWTLAAFNPSQSTVPPKIVLNQTSGLVTNTDPTITGDVTDTIYGVTGLAVSLDGGTTTPVAFDSLGDFSVPVDLAVDGSADGAHTLTFTAADAAGNVSAPLTFDFTLDTVAPSISLATDSLQSGGTLSAGAVLDGTVTTESGVALTALSYAIDGGTAMPIGFDATSGGFDQALDLTPLATGGHTVVLTATDAAGNSVTDTLNVTLPALPPLTIAALTPAMGASDVGVTYRPEVTFSRAVNPSTVTSGDFYATDSTGAIVPATILMTSDDTGAYLLFTNPMPGASTITLHVDGGTITAAAGGALLDAAGTGTPGSDLTETFTTVSTASVPDTTITGIVVDPGPDNTPMTPDDFKAAPDGASDFANDTWKLPIAGVKVYVLGDEQDAVYTNAQGQFTLTNAPVGDVKIVVDGTTATNAPSGYYFPTMTMDLTNVRPGIVNTLMGSMGTLAEQEADATDPAVYLPRVASNILTPLSATKPTVIVAPPDTDFGSGQVSLTAQQLSELSLTVMPGSVVDANGNPVANPTVGISPVPPAIVQDMLPAGILQHTFDITIQAPGGAVFTQPAMLTVPNTMGLAPGTQTYVLSFDHTTGQLVIDGTATVSADGSTITTNPGSGVSAPGWHGFTPVGSQGSGGSEEIPNGRISVGSAFADIVKGALDTVQSTLTVVQDIAEFSGGLGLVGSFISAFSFVKDLTALINEPNAENFAAFDLDVIFILAPEVGLAVKLAQAALDAVNLATDYTTLQGDISNAQAAVLQYQAGPIADEASSNAAIASGIAAADQYAAQSQQVSAAITAAMPALEAWNGNNPAMGGLNSTQIAALSSLASTLQSSGSALLGTSQSLANGNASIAGTSGQFFGQATGSIFTQAPQSPNISGAAPSEGQSGYILYASLQAADGSVQRFSFNPNAPLSYFLAPQTFYSITVFDPQTLYVGTGYFESSSSGTATQIPTVGLSPDNESQLADGLTATAAYVIGVNPDIPDNFIPGISDLAAIQEGLVAATSLVSTTGVITTLPMSGSAQAIVVVGSTTNLAQQTAYIATEGYGLAIVDVSNYQAPVLLGQLQLTGNATDVADDPALGLAAVATGSDLQIVNVANPASPGLVQKIAIDATTVQVFDGIAYTNDGATLDAVDLASGTILQRLTLGTAALTGLALDGSTLYVMDASDRLTIVDLSGTQMVEDGSVVLPAGGGRLSVANGVAYVPTNNVTSGGYLTVDVSNPAAPRLIQSVQNTGIESAAIALNGSGLGVAVGKDGGGANGVVGADVINTSDPTNTGQFITRFTLPSQPQDPGTEPFDVAIGEGIAFVAAGTSGLQVVNYTTIDTSGVGPTITVSQEPGGNAPGTTAISMTEGTNAAFQVSVTDPGQVRNVALLVNGTVAVNDVSYPYDLSTMLPSIAANGSNQVTLAVQATDTAGNTATTNPVTVTLLPDTSPPVLVDENIFSGAIVGPGFQSLDLQFSKPLDASTVTAANFALTGTGGTTITPTSVQVLRGGLSVELTYAPLTAGSYQFTIDAPAVLDTAGVALGASASTIGFTVRPFSVIWTNPLGGSWNVASNWSTGKVPGASDTVGVGLPLGDTVTFSGPATTVAELVTTGGGALDLTATSLTVTGAMDIGGTLSLGNATLADAILGGTGTIEAATGTNGGVMINVTIDAGSTYTIGGNAATALTGTITNQGTIALTAGTGNATLLISDDYPYSRTTMTLTGGGTVALSNSANNLIYDPSGHPYGTLVNANNLIAGAGNIGDGNLVLDNQAAGTIDADQTLPLILQLSSFTNEGLIEATAGGTLQVSIAFANSGTLWARNGSLIVSGALSGTGTAEITGASTLELGSTVSSGQTVVFNSGATGTLRLDDSRQFSGTIGGLATNGSNALDLSDISFISGTTRATFAGTASGGTLTVSEATNVANLVLTGNYVGQSWVVSSDGHGGTKVIDPDPSDATVDSAATAISSGPASATLASLFPWSRNAVAPGDLLQAYPWLNPTSGSDTRAGLPSFNTATSPASFVPVFVERVSAWPAPVPSGT